MTTMTPLYERDAFEIVGKSLPVLMVMADDIGTIIWANQRAETIFRVKRVGGLLGKVVEDLIPVGKRPEHKHLRMSYNANPDMRPMGIGRKVTGQRMDGTQFDCIVLLVPAHAEGKDVNLAVIVEIGPVEAAYAASLTQPEKTK